MEKKGKRESDRQNTKKMKEDMQEKNVAHYGMTSGKGNNISKNVKAIP